MLPFQSRAGETQDGPEASQWASKEILEKDGDMPRGTGTNRKELVMAKAATTEATK